MEGEEEGTFSSGERGSSTVDKAQVHHSSPPRCLMGNFEVVSRERHDEASPSSQQGLGSSLRGSAVKCFVKFAAAPG